jgi:hypothetical protein
MILPYIHGACKMCAGPVTSVTKEDRSAYGGLRHYAKCAFKHKTVDINSRGCKHWEAVDEAQRNES